MKQNTSSRLRRRWLLGTTAIGLVCVLGVGLPARAANECGTIANGEVTCTPAGNDYTGGITYNPAENLTMVVQDGVTIAPASGSEGIDVTFSAANLYDLTLRLHDSDTGTDVSTTGFGAEGIFIRNARHVVLYNDADISAAGDDAIEFRSIGTVTVINSGTLSAGNNAIHSLGALNLTNSGSITASNVGVYNFVGSGDTSIVLTETSSIVAGGLGIRVFSTGSGSTGNVFVSNSGSITTQADSASGINLHGIQGYASVVQSGTGLILTEGDIAHGIFLYSTQNYANVNVSGSITTTGDYSSAIRVTGADADVAVSVIGDLVTEGLGSHGIYVNDTIGNVDVTIGTVGDTVAAGASGDITTHGDRARGIYVSSTDGNATVSLSDTGSITTYGGRAEGIHVLRTAGDVSVTAAGAINTSGDFSSGVRVNDTSGDVAVTLSETGSITTYGPGANGIEVQEISGDVEISASGVITTHGSQSYGMYLSDIDGKVSLASSADITAYSELSSAIVLGQVDNAAIIVSGSILTGKNYAGAPTLFAEAAGLVVDESVGYANITLTETSSIDTYGLRSWGVRFQNIQDYAVLTAAGQITTEGDDAAAIYFDHVAGSVNAVVAATGSITTYGAAAHGIHVLHSTDDVNVTVDGSINTFGYSSSGIHVNDTSGDVAVTLSKTGVIATYSVDTHGIYILNTGENVSVAAAGAIGTLGNLSSGIYINNTLHDVTITLAYTGGITTDGDEAHGIHVLNSGDVTATAAGAINTSGDSSSGFYIDDTYGDVTVTLFDSGSITTYGYSSSGISVRNTGDGIGTDHVEITAGGRITTYGADARGIEVQYTRGDVTVTLSDTSSIHIYGSRAAAVSIEGTTGTTTVAADGDINTYSHRSHGLSLNDNSGDVNITLSGNISSGNNYASAPSTVAYASGLFLKDNDGNISVTLSDGSSVTTHGFLSHGIALQDTGGFAEITASGDIVTEGNISWGVFLARTAGDVTVTQGGSIITSGIGSDGIFILQADDVSVSAAGDIATKGRYSSAITLADAGTATVTASRTTATYGQRSHGIEINSTDGKVDVTVSGDIETGLYYANSATRSYAYGTWVKDTSGDVNVELTETGSILTHGGLAHGIALAGTGSASDNHNVTLDIAGTVNASGLDADGVQVSDTDGIVQIAIDGSVTGGGGDGAGVVLDNPNATSSAITIGATGAVGALSDIAIRAVEPVTISNAGTVTGMVDLGDGDDSFTNSGTWYLRNYADFSGGEDQFINTGTLGLSKGTASLWLGEIASLESFQHGGTIDLQDGIPGDTLSISGNFKSDGGSLLLDAVLDRSSSSPADTLILENVSLLSASTKIFVTNAGGLGVLGDAGILLVDADVDDSGGEAFTLGQAVIGAYEYKLHYDDAADAWYLRNLVTDTGSPSIFAGTEEYPALMTAALLSFGADWSALHNRLSDDRFQAAEEKIEPASWTRASAPRLRPWLQVNGARQEITADTAFDQQVAKLTGGADVPFALGPGRALIGAFAGTGRNTQDFDGSASEAESDAAIAGLYASYRSGGFYGNGIVKYEHYWAELYNEATSGAGAPFEIDIWGGSLETGYRFHFERSYVQPRLRLNTAHAASSSLEDASGERIDLEAANSLTGEAAARLGLALAQGEIYLDGGVRHEFLGEPQAVVSALSFRDALPGTSSFVSGGLLLRMLDDKVLLSLEGGYARGAEGEELTANAALRVVY